MRISITTVSAICGCLLAACGDNGVTTTESTESSSTGSTGSMTTTTTTTTTTSGEPTTSSTTDCFTGCVTISTTDVSTTVDITTGSTTDNTTGSTTDNTTGSTGSSTGGSSSTGMVDLCANGVLDQDETDVDCGGAICGDCQDGQICLVNDDCASLNCQAGVCAMPECQQDADCAMMNDACNTGFCDLNVLKCAKQAMPDGVQCDDANLCTDGDTCTAGVCGGMNKDCSALNTTCGTGACNAMSGMCETQPDAKKDGVACDDGKACTANTTCMAGACGNPNDTGVAFNETFANNMAGWTLAQGWEIKPAAVSPAGCCGADPATDHTPSMDNGVAGQFVGALVTSVNTTQGQFNCLTSPVVNTSAMPSVWLTFWKHAHLDYTPFVANKTEVYNGNTWIQLEAGYPDTINDANWTQKTFDITAHKSATTQVRICHQRNSGAFSHAGWSVDDLTIAQATCTP